MVASKRCKVCAVIDAKNVLLSGNYFGKSIPKLIEKICGIEIDSRKANGVLICELCIIQLLHTDVVMEKVRNAVQRLKSNAKPKPKTPSKGGMLKTVAQSLKEEQNDANETDAVSNATASAQNENGALVKTTDSISEINGENFGETSQENEETENRLNVKSKFDKILDELTPIKKTKGKSKRKLVSTSDPNKNVGLDVTDLGSPILKKRKKNTSISASEESAYEKNVDESKAKVMNCSICGKGYNGKNELRDHIESAHMGERLKACPHCSSEFRSQQKYESHVFKEKCKNSNYACQYPRCDKRFKTVHKMELHMQEKHSSQNECVISS